MHVHALTVVVLALLVVLTSAIAEDIQIMGLTARHTALGDDTKALDYLTGTCQKKHRHMTCALHQIVIKKIDTAPLAAKANEIIARAKQNPDILDNFVTRHLPPLCTNPESAQAMREAPPESEHMSPEERALRKATWQFCAERSEDTLRALFDLWLQMQAHTCAIWVTSYEQRFALRGKEWISQRGPYGACGIIETAVLSSPLANAKGQAIRFNRYKTHQRRTRKDAPRCPAGADEAKEYVFVLEKPWYTECVYIDFSPETFGWSFWDPSAP